MRNLSNVLPAVSKLIHNPSATDTAKIRCQIVKIVNINRGGIKLVDLSKRLKDYGYEFLYDDTLIKLIQSITLLKILDYSDQSTSEHCAKGQVFIYTP